MINRSYTRNAKKRNGNIKHINRIIDSYTFAFYSVLSDDSEKIKNEKFFSEKEKTKTKI